MLTYTKRCEGKRTPGTLCRSKCLGSGRSRAKRQCPKRAPQSESCLLGLKGLLELLDQSSLDHQSSPHLQVIARCLFGMLNIKLSTSTVASHLLAVFGTESTSITPLPGMEILGGDSQAPAMVNECAA